MFNHLSFPLADFLFLRFLRFLFLRVIWFFFLLSLFWFFRFFRLFWLFLFEGKLTLWFMGWVNGCVRLQSGVRHTFFEDGLHRILHICDFLLSHCFEGWCSKTQPTRSSFGVNCSREGSCNGVLSHLIFSPKIKSGRAASSEVFSVCLLVVTERPLTTETFVASRLWLHDMIMKISLNRVFNKK